ncbi:MAG: DUF3800 domain-containing protein [Desulfovibrio sp.]|nr:DUF3800 domain-containing protein [Desulfovibrio sp.]
MYLFYVDESGTLDPEVTGTRSDGTHFDKEWLYSMTAIGLFEHKWRQFYYPSIQKKRLFIDEIYRREGVRLELNECEVKSAWIRIPKERARHPLFSRISDKQMNDLVESYYCSLENIHLCIFAVVVDKRHLRDNMDRQKLHRKAWELLCERIENFMREFHPKHKALLVADDVSKQDNSSLAMKHAYHLEQGTSCGLRFKNIIETPFFVPSELSEGVQFADLCSYNIYRAFKNQDFDYPFFQRMLPKMYSSERTPPQKIDGIKVFPDESPLVGAVERKSTPE